MRNLLIITIISLLQFSCKEDLGLPNGTPSCIEDIIYSNISNPTADKDPLLMVMIYIYNNSKLYIYEYGSNNTYVVETFDENCNLICTENLGGVVGYHSSCIGSFYNTNQPVIKDTIWEK